MRKNISRAILLLFCLTLLVLETGCQNHSELIENCTGRLNNTYWHWIDTSPTGEDITSYCYAYINEDGTFDDISYSHRKSEVFRKVEGYSGEEGWEVIVHKGKPCVKIRSLTNANLSPNHILIDVDEEGKVESLSKSLYLPGSKYYDIKDTYVMTELSQDEYEAALAEEERNLANYEKNKSKDNKSSFTNQYGTKNTKCAHIGCDRTIASSGDTNCCTVHSRRCLNCSKYIDEDAMYCMSCLR